MNKRLYSVLNVKDTFSHEYDFGSTTDLDGQLQAVREGYLGDNKALFPVQEMGFLLWIS